MFEKAIWNGWFAERSEAFTALWEFAASEMRSQRVALVFSSRPALGTMSFTGTRILSMLPARAFASSDRAFLALSQA